MTVPARRNGQNMIQKEMNYQRSMNLGKSYPSVYEKDSGQSGVVTDETKYLLEVPVKAIVDGDTTTLSIDSDNLNIYKIIDEDNLLKTTAEDDYVYAEINKNAVENAEKNVTFKFEYNDKIYDDDDEVDIDLETVADFVCKEAEEEGEGPFDPQDVFFVVQADLDFQEQNV